MTEEKLEQKPVVAPSVKTEPKTPKRTRWSNAEEILHAFKLDNPNAINSYNQLCVALESFPTWEEAPRTQFLQKFYGCANELDDKCDAMLKKFMNLQFNVVPISEHQGFIDLMRQIAVRHVSQTQNVLSFFVRNFMPHGFTPNVDGVENEDSKCEQPEWQYALSKADQEHVYTLLHCAIRQTIKAFPVVANSLKRIVAIRFPHHLADQFKFFHYFRNVIMMLEYIPYELHADMWSIAISQLFPLDTFVSSKVSEARNADVRRRNSGIFVIDQEDAENLDADAQMMEGEGTGSEADFADRSMKLDTCMLYCIGWISRFYTPIRNASNEFVLSWLPALSEEQRQRTDLFELFKKVFEDEILFSHDIHSIPFIWMYMASQDDAVCSKILNHLWSIIIRPSASPNEWKKSQGAACYLAGFLARTNSYSSRVVLKWLGEMTSWCTRYVNEVAGSLSLNSVGGLRHGTFYAVCQAAFLTFCFRYKQIVEAEQLCTVQKWGFGHIVHSYLSPLSYINRPVALCFAAISRSLQIVYCNHLLSNIEESRRPFESVFPFDVCVLPLCKEHMSSAVQKFSPMHNDISVISNEFLRGQVTVTKIGDDDNMNVDDNPDAFGFMYDDDITEVIEVTGGKSLAMNISSRSQPFTHYSQSPGLCSMEFF
ncbi:hypothetical protein QR680_013183 [Steinernema hermaphroditum]|uniref:RNA polymerase I-specific transcription initiation factor RRN3 n=1 Tax=Steinernema hermaphroditum TaxID=289476 RepID=A0AA39I7G0_9BILA|nr:hypothetical protein QR680_013183 [Steinernema hermaphroditum]